MNKERLEELRKRVFVDYQEWDVKCSQDGFQEASPTGEMDADGKDLTTLIDAELTRQSVTDEAVRVAIEWAEQERKNNFRYMNFGDADNAALAIDALRQMKPDLYLQAGNDPDADDWGNGYGRGYADGLQAHKKPSDDADVAEIIATGEYLYGLNDDNLADLVIQTNEVQNYIVESFTALRQYQKPTDEAVRDCSTCIGCECEPELGETVKNCKCYIKREPTDEAVQDAISWLESDKIDRQREWEKQDTDWKLEPGAKEMHDSFMSAFDLAIQALRQMKPSEWIPVSERLPTEELASVLVYTKNGGVSEGQYYPTIKSWKQFRWSVENATVTHWMPLPQPPESDAKQVTNVIQDSLQDEREV